MTDNVRPKVGLGVLIVKDNKVLLGKYTNVGGEGSWRMPGGHLELGESFFECAKRETLEETGLEIHNLRVSGVSNEIMKDCDKHYITVVVQGDVKGGALVVGEPEKFECWDWFALKNLPSPLFGPSEKAIKNFVNKKFCSDN